MQIIVIIIICFITAGLLMALIKNVNLSDELDSVLKQLAEAEKDAIYDHLTGLISRREFERLLNLDFARQSRLREEGQETHNDCTLIFFDIDKFKDVNDTHGHDAGDFVLVRFSHFLKSIFHRQSDVVCRRGGDEFVVLLTSTDLDSCQKMLETFYKALEGLFIVLPNGVEIKISVSAGCAPASNHREPSSLITEADRNMYVSKLGQAKM